MLVTLGMFINSLGIIYLLSRSLISFSFFYCNWSLLRMVTWELSGLAHAWPTLISPFIPIPTAFSPIILAFLGYGRSLVSPRCLGLIVHQYFKHLSFSLLPLLHWSSHRHLLCNNFTQEINKYSDLPKFLFFLHPNFTS